MQQALTRLTLLQALTHRRFALLWSGQTLSRFGDHLYQIALVWWVLEQSGSATAMGAVLFCATLPMLLFLLLGGVAGDRWPRVSIMLVSDLGRGVLVAGVALLAAFHALQVWELCLASFLFGCVDAFFQPAYTAIVPDVTPAEALPSANALTNLGLHAARIAGPALGATLVATGGPATAFALNAVSFLLAAACLVPLRSAGSLPSAVPLRAAHVWHDVREALDLVRRVPWIWMTIALYAVTNVLLSGPYSIALPALVQIDWRADVATLGFLYMTFPIGYILGGVWAGQQGRLHRRGVLVYGGTVLAGLMILAFGLPIPLAFLAFAALINGACLEVDGLVWTHMLQELVPREKLSRVASIDNLGSSAFMPLGYALVGWGTDHVGATLVFLVCGGLTVGVAAFGLLHPAIRRLD